MHNLYLVVVNLVVFSAAWLFSYLEIPIEYLLILGALMSFDVVFGVWKCLSLGREVTSRRLIGGIMGKATALAMVFVLALAAKGIVIASGGGFDFKHLLSAILVFILIGETHSVIRNFIAVVWKLEVPEWSVWIFLARTMVEIAEKLTSKVK